MARFSGSADVLIKLESEDQDEVCSEEHEVVPMKQRLKLRLASKHLPLSGIEMAANSGPLTDIAARNHSNYYCSQEEKIGIFGEQENGEVKECVSKAEGDKKMGQSRMTADNIMLDKVDAVDTSLQQLLPSDLPIKTKVSAINSLEKYVSCASEVDAETTAKIKHETPDGFLDNLDFMLLKDRQRMLLSRKAPSLESKTVEGTSLELSSLVEDDWIKQGNGVGHDLLCSTTKTLHEQDSNHGSDLSFDSSKARFSSAIVNVKVEPLDSIKLETTGKHATGNAPYNSFLPLKIEQEVCNDSCIDKLDHMLLRERMKLFSKTVISFLRNDKISASLSKTVPSVVDSTPIATPSAKPLKVNYPQKQRKTTTDSVEVALEEDAPGLLQVLLEKGVSLDEIKLYGEPESNEALDDLSTEDSFTELEDIISKLLSRRRSFFKLGPLHLSKEEKASYCLACLFSLVEQARYLQFRKWPVEWGWCRDLQSFIFIFERHNRIVLERPEYGYAMYFFELMESLPIHWQIKRLVTAMKLTSCSRVSLIENRALLVGEDMTEGEARVLMEYGWIPNTGLGSMLNYCDRVVHNRKHEKDSSKWRSRIRKMLVDGYNGGKIQPTEIPMNLSTCNVAVDNKGTSPELSSLAEDDWIKQGTGVAKGDNNSSDRDFPIAEDLKPSDLSNFTIHGLSQREYLSNLITPEGIQGNDLLCSTTKTLHEPDSSHGLDFSFDSSKARSSAIVNVKVEPLDSIELETKGKHATENPPYNSFLPVKVCNDSCIDKLDYMLLRERMKLLSKKVITSLGNDGISASLSKIVPSTVDSTPIASVAAKPFKVHRPCKRRKTATDSVEVALEEDAPGLLKVLLEKGVSLDEIKLYGEPESNDALDDLSTEDSFAELEDIISKLFSSRQSFLKLGPLHFSKGEKASYCLGCLFSLVEQARYLQFRKWPVEWGWCRDLQSFIFVFERHNRIVLERPEYGYATYFFELVESISIHWQIKRLVTAMKLTSCSRISLIENRALLVGEDLSEGEARVLMGFGWIPNTGLGSMLNYCDRVVHDSKHEKDSSEWKSKIGKMLVDGYNGGKIEPANLSSYNVAEDTKAKLEFD